MTNREIEDRIRSAMAHAAPDRRDAILSRCQTRKGNIQAMKTRGAKPSNPTTSTTRAARPAGRRARSPWRLALASAAAVLVLVCAGALALSGVRRSNAVDARITLDVNPSLVITVNASERVLAVEPLNADATAIIGDMALKGTQLDVAVNALVGSMLQKGYLDELQNAILVSVENDDAEKAAALQARITDSINGLFAGSTSIAPAVLSQSLAETEDLTALAAQYKISAGKAALIRSLIGQDATLRFESLAPLSVNEITLIAESRGLHAEAVTQTGEASDKAYIGEEAAKSAALSHAGLEAADVSFWQVELDSEDGRMVYELEFYAADAEYEYEIDARTGAIVKQSVEREQATQPAGTDAGAAADAHIGEEAAKAAALSHAGVKEGAISGLSVKLDRDDGRVCYDVKFYANDAEYDYEIDAVSGAVRKAEHESAAPADSPATDGGYIGKEKAMAIALDHAGVKQSEASGLRAELDRDDGRVEYEVEFHVGNVEYDYEIDATTGKIRKADKEIDDD